VREALLNMECRLTDSFTLRPSNEANFRTAAYEALVSLVASSAGDTIPVVQRVSLTMLNRMEQLLSMQNQLIGVDDRSNWNELQSNLCSVCIVSVATVS
jgi:importin subunit beta-1